VPSSIADLLAIDPQILAHDAINGKLSHVYVMEKQVDSTQNIRLVVHEEQEKKNTARLIETMCFECNKPIT
jgi:hypothetical protein